MEQPTAPIGSLKKIRITSLAKPRSYTDTFVSVDQAIRKGMASKGKLQLPKQDPRGNLVSKAAGPNPQLYSKFKFDRQQNKFKVEIGTKPVQKKCDHQAAALIIPVTLQPYNLPPAVKTFKQTPAKKPPLRNIKIVCEIPVMKGTSKLTSKL